MTWTSRLLSRLDAVVLLTVYLVLLLTIPSRLVFLPLGGAGSPANMFGLVLFGIWLLFRVQRHDGRPHQTVRSAFFVMVCCFAVAYVVGMTRPISSDEASTSMLSLVLVFGWAGILLVSNDLVPDQESLRRVLHRMVFGGGCLGVLGIVQFLTGHAIVDHLWIPGLSFNTDQSLASILQRGGLNRPSGTAIHPIEFGAVITMLLPIALTVALTDRTRSRLRVWFPVAMMAFAAVLCISRSALLSGGISLVVLALNWAPKVRRRAAVVAVCFVGLVALAVPGLIGTFVGLFSSIDHGDTSAASRTNSLPIALAFVQRSPLFGRGFGTFLPEIHILDNAYLGLAIEVGLVGLLSFLVLVVTAIRASQLARRLAPTAEARDLSHALTASIVAGATGLALYDGLGFPMGAAMIFLLLGLAGAARRIALADTASPDATSGAESGADLGHRRAGSVP